MSEPRCLNCKYLHKNGDGWDHVYTCRRYPPSQQGFPRINSTWTDWCGEYQEMDRE